MLPAETQAEQLFTAQSLPEQDFGQGHARSQFTGTGQRLCGARIAPRGYAVRSASTDIAERGAAFGHIKIVTNTDGDCNSPSAAKRGTSPFGGGPD
ncbi:MAG: hypothetical protein HBSAPP03_18180 [Phycisphaerae bacterium]|nr:MAG: hypothetical protein HBSAPP03_18180 [Phycisphaerae bacterium]